MTVLVKLTQSSGDAVYVNPAHVVRVRGASANQTLIIFSKDDSVTVKERLDEVVRLLQQPAAAQAERASA